MADKKPLLFDANGKPLALNPQLPPWRGVSTGRRARDWNVSGSGINTLLGNNLGTLIRRSRQSVRDDVHAGSAIESIAADGVGTGLRPIPNIDDDSKRQEVLDLWDAFVSKADSEGVQSLYGQQSTVIREVKEAGECFARIRRRRFSDKLPVPLQVELYPSEMLDPSYSERLSPSRVIKNGIEFNNLGQRTAYYFFREHPGESSDMRIFGSSQFRRVPASQVMHVFPILRAGQIRGVPGLSAAITKLKDVADATDAFIERAKVQNLYTTFETIPAEDSASFIDYQNSDGSLDVEDEYGVPERGLQPGGHYTLPPGHGIELGNPNSGSFDFYQMVKGELHAVAAGAGTTYEKMTSDLSDVNFSSIRSGLISLYRKLEVFIANTLEFQFCCPIWQEFVLQAQISGTMFIPDTEREQQKLLCPRWITTPGREYVDPEKEVRAQILSIRAGLVPRSSVVMQNSGMDISELERINKEDRERAERFGNTYDTDVVEEQAPEEEEPSANTKKKPALATN